LSAQENYFHTIHSWLDVSKFLNQKKLLFGKHIKKLKKVNPENHLSAW
jgi:predicted nucleotidyltransferase